MKTMYFPMKTLRVTQGYGIAWKGVAADTYSHAGSYALDLGGADGGADWLFAPCDMVVRRVYGSYNAVWFESLEPLESIGSTVILLCLHMNNADRDALGIKVGKVFRQGEKCYREGMAGNVTGTHVHIEVGRGPLRGTGWAQNAQGVWTINDKLVPNEIFTLGEDVTVLDGHGYDWRREVTVKPLSGEPVRMQCVASIGDQRTLGEVMEGLGIGYTVEGDTVTTAIAVSAGDQITLIRAAQPLGIQWRVYEEKTEGVLKAGSPVRIREDRVLTVEGKRYGRTYTGGRFRLWFPRYTLKELSGDRAVLTVMGMVAAAVNAADLEPTD